jgi:hypothetical protein
MFTIAAGFLVDANTFRIRAAEMLMQATRTSPCEDLHLHIAMQYERLARSAEDAAALFMGLENASREWIEGRRDGAGSAVLRVMPRSGSRSGR